LSSNTPRIKRSPRFVSSIAALTLTVGITASFSAQQSQPCPDGYGAHDDHIVQIDADGDFRTERSGNRKEDADQRVEELFEKVRKSGRNKILLYVHGGRISLSSAVANAKRLGPIIWCETDAYPIFFCWDSEQFSSYFRHLAYERNGVSYRGSYAAVPSALVSPLVFGADLGRGLARLPINTSLSYGKLLQNVDLLVGPHRVLFPVKKKYEEQLTRFVDDVPDGIENGFVYRPHRSKAPSFYVSLGQDAQGYQLKFIALQLLTLPFQFTTEPIIDTVGTPAWGNMVRRTRSMFHLATNYVSQPGSESQAKTSYVPGAGTIFFDHLRSHLRNRKDATLEIYAHSMGAIVINEAYAQFPDLPANRIVYMAAACSMREFRDTTGQYLEKHHRVPFYNLSLHPRCELDDVEAFGVPVRGSLLVWVDEFFENPKAFGDRTLGTFENIVIAQDMLPDSPSIHLKVFPVEEGKGVKETGLYLGPQRHGDFDDYHFWKKEFWNTDDKNIRYERISKPPQQ
jgi:hypothetical protein